MLLVPTVGLFCGLINNPKIFVYVCGCQANRLTCTAVNCREVGSK